MLLVLNNFIRKRATTVQVYLRPLWRAALSALRLCILHGPTNFVIWACSWPPHIFHIISLWNLWWRAVCDDSVLLGMYTRFWSLPNVAVYHGCGPALKTVDMASLPIRWSNGWAVVAATENRSCFFSHTLRPTCRIPRLYRFVLRRRRRHLVGNSVDCAACTHRNNVAHFISLTAIKTLNTFFFTLY